MFTLLVGDAHILHAASFIPYYASDAAGIINVHSARLHFPPIRILFAQVGIRIRIRELGPDFRLDFVVQSVGTSLGANPETSGISEPSRLCPLLSAIRPSDERWITYLVGPVFDMSTGEGLNPAFTIFTLDFKNSSLFPLDDPAWLGHERRVAETRL